ncbi:MAG: hypothetical protein ACTHM9_08755 [Gemmatimonadales bacterium]
MSASRTTSVVVLAAVLWLGAGDRLAAQTGTPAAWQATPASVLKGALRSLAAAQDRYHALHGAYAATVDLLGLKLDPGVRLEMLAAGAEGWQAKAVHTSQPGKSCVVWAGALAGEPPRTDGDREMAGEEGIPLCDRMR